MAVEQNETLDRVVGVMRRTFIIPSGFAISRSTSSADVSGWDSLSHSLFILAVEDAFGIDLPIDKTYEMNDVGDLVDLISGTQTKGATKR